MKLTKKAINELYSFVVGSNLEHSLLNQLDDRTTKPELKRWLQV